jgi:hypothetical protein
VSYQDPYYAYWSRAYPAKEEVWKNPLYAWLDESRKYQLRHPPGSPETVPEVIRDIGKGTILDVKTPFTQAVDVGLGTGEHGSGTSPVLTEKGKDGNGGANKEKCAKLQCGHPLDPTQWGCYAEKTKLGCGGSTQFTGCLMLGLPDFGLGQLGCFIIPGAILGLILLVVLLK